MLWWFISIGLFATLSVLHENARIKEHIKPKGWPKQSSKLWPSKNKKRQREKENEPCSNAQPAKRQKTCQLGTAANQMRIKRELKRKETCESDAIPSSDYIELLRSDKEDTDNSKKVVANVNIFLQILRHWSLQLAGWMIGWLMLDYLFSNKGFLHGWIKECGECSRLWVSWGV